MLKTRHISPSPNKYVSGFYGNVGSAPLGNGEKQAGEQSDFILGEVSQTTSKIYLWQYLLLSQDYREVCPLYLRADAQFSNESGPAQTQTPQSP